MRGDRRAAAADERPEPGFTITPADVSGWQINVDTRDRIVRVVTIARETHGVACVVDQLTVRTPARGVTIHSPR
jgi:hypothetical protein